MNTPENNPRKRADDATSERLAKLRAIPVDVSELRKSIEAQIPRPRRAPRIFGPRWLDLRTAAASLAVIGLVVAIVLYSFSGPVLASPDRLAHIHEEVLMGCGSHATHVDSVDAANAFLSSKWHGAPTIPDLPQDHVTACCIHMMGHKNLVCLSFEADGVAVTMAVADVADVKIPDSTTMTVGGVICHVQSQGGTNMVMAQRAGRWVCLMGKLPAERLVEIASSLRF